MKKFLIKYDEEKGETFFEGLSSEVFQRGHLAAMEQAFIEIGHEKAEKIIFETTKKFAMETVNKYNLFLISFARFRRKDVAELLLKQLPQRGLGFGKITEWNEQTDHIVIEVKNSFESHKIKTVRPACISLLAIICGAYEILFNKQCDGKETQCTAKGDPICVFECKPMEK